MSDAGALLAPVHPGPAPVRKGVYLLPNLITTAGLFAGFYSVIASFHADFFAAAVAILDVYLSLASVS